MTKTSAAVAISLLSSCASSQSPEAWEERIRASARSNPPLLVVPGQSVGNIFLGMTRSDVRGILGPRRGDQAPWEYLTRGYALIFSDDGVAAILGGAGCPPDSALVDAFKGRTAEGLGMGSSRAQILAAFGEPQRDRRSGDAEYLTYSRIGIEFSLWRGTVSHMTIRSWPPNKGMKLTKPEYLGGIRHGWPVVMNQVSQLMPSVLQTPRVRTDGRPYGWLRRLSLARRLVGQGGRGPSLSGTEDSNES